MGLFRERMVKMKNKLLSVLLAVFMVMTIVPTVYADAPSDTVIDSVLYDAWIGSGSAAGTYPAENYLRIARNMNQDKLWKNTAIASLAWDLSGVFETLENNPGYVVKSVKMCATTYYWGSAPGLKLNLYNIDTKWSETDEDGFVTFTSGNKAKILPIDPANVDFPDFIREPDLVLDGTYAQRNSDGTLKADITEEYDITHLFRLHQAKNHGTDMQNYFSFAIDSVADSGNYEFNIRTKEHGNPASLVVEYSLLEELTEEDATLPVFPDDSLNVVYNNPLSDAKIKVNGSLVTDGISFSGTNLNFDYPFENNTVYFIDVSVTDIYGQTASGTYSFVTTHEIMSEDSIAASSSFITSSGAGTFPGMGVNAKYYGEGNNNNSMVVYGFELPKAGNGYIENAVFRFWSTSEASGEYKRVYEFDGDWVLSGDGAITTLDDSVTAIIDNYDEYAITNVKCTSNRGEYYAFDADITSYVNRLLSDGRSGTAYIAVCSFGSDSGKYVRKNPDSSIASFANPYFYATLNENPEIYCMDKSFEIEGNSLKTLSFKFTTLFDKDVIESNVFIKDEDGNILDDVVLKYDTDTSSVYLESEVMLDTDKAYSVVINAGIEDKFLNFLESDIIVTAFSANENVPVGKNQNETVKCTYNSETMELSVTYVNGMYHNRSTKVSLIDNEIGEAVYTLDVKSNENGMIRFVLEDVEPDISYTLHIYPQNAPNVSYIDVLNDAYKNYIWKIAATSKDAETLYEKLDVICSGFELKIGCEEYITDIFDFCEKLASTREIYKFSSDFSEEENEKMAVVFNNLGLFTALETFSHTEDEEIYESLFKNALSLCSEDFSLKISKLENEEYELYSKIYEEFLNGEKDINTISDFEEYVNSIYNNLKAGEILKKFAGVTHISEVGIILTDKETVSVFGIKDIIDDYQKLKSTEYVDKKFYKKEIPSVDEFVTLLKSSVEKAKKDEKDDDKVSSKPSSGKGSSASGSMGSTGFTPILDITPQNPEVAGKLSFSDLAGYEWAEEYIELLSSEGIISGKSEGVYAPSDSVKREEVAKMIVGEFKFSQVSSDGSFSDVSSDAWYAPYVYALKDANIARGISDTLFGTGNPITRQDAAVMLCNALESHKSKFVADKNTDFADFDSVAGYAKEAVTYMASIGVINGYSDNTFAPSSTITRAEFAVMLGRIHKLIN